MNKVEFLTRLEKLLQDIPYEERKQAIEYYDDYFTDAGAEKEQVVLKELESPEKIAKMLKADLKENILENNDGEYTETGYVDPSESRDRYELSRNNELKKTQNQYQQYKGPRYEKKEIKRRPQRQSFDFGKIILIILFCLFGLPVLLPLAGAVFILGFSIFMTVVGSIFAFFLFFICLTIGLVLGGIILIGAGLGHLFHFTIFSLAMMGIGMILLGSGLLCGFFSIQVWKKGVLRFCRFTIDSIRKLFQKSRGMQRENEI